MRQATSRSNLSPSGRSMLVSGRETARHFRVSWFGRNGRFPVPAMPVFRVGGPFGSRIAEGGRPRRREASCVLGMPSGLGVKVPCAT